MSRDWKLYLYFGLDDKVLWDTLEDDFVQFEVTLQKMGEKYL
jgi:uncharacterized protein with HEPN domain